MTPPLRPFRHRAAVGLVLLAGAAALLSLTVHAQDNARDAERLATALALREGMTVVELGAGTGDLTVAVARIVGPAGRVYSNEINPDRRADIRKAVDAAALSHVTIVEGQAAHANVPEACCDAAFMRNVYHHFGDPAAMNRSLFAALKPGGRIAIIDFPPRRGGESAPPGARAESNRHGVTPETVIEELEAAGFQIVSTDRPSGRWFMVVAQK
ncbi:MAG: methyltransferase domain-containing protein [Vicinamibacterales bacterium]|nr:methyltransferase domain-containing protein [Vicinamibacterales bacterium]